MSTTLGVRQQRQLQTRDRLLDAATRVFASHGFDGASMPQIAEEAGVSTGAIYSNFSGKEELFLAMIARVAQAGASRRADAMQDETADRDDLVDHMTRDWVSTVDDQPDVVMLMAEFWLYAVRRDDMRELVATFLQGIRGTFADTIDELADLDADDRDTAAFALQALAYGYAMQRVADPEAVTGDQFTRATQWLLRGAEA